MINELQNGHVPLPLAIILMGLVLVGAVVAVAALVYVPLALRDRRTVRKLYADIDQLCAQMVNTGTLGGKAEQ
jgi:uncharacterized integral membrane protein